MTSISDHSHTGATPPAERELQAQRLVMEHAQKLAHIGHWEFQADGTTIYASPQVLEIFDLPQGTMPSAAEFRALVPQSELDQVEAAISAVRSGHPSTPVRHRVMRPDGTVRWVDHSFDLRPGTSGNTPVLMGVMKDVTDEVASLDAMRQSAEAIRLSSEALRESDARQREALRIARASMWTWDRRTRTVWRSPGLYQMFGFDGLPDDPKERLAFLHPDDRETYRRTYEESIRHRSPFTVRYRLGLPDGRWVWIEDRGAPVFDTSGELTGYRGAAQDVDEQVRYEVALRESDERQRQALRLARASIWRWDRRTRKIWNSAALFEMLGYESNGEGSSPTNALRHPDDLERATRTAESAIQRREPYAFRTRLAHADGRWLWVEERGAPVFDSAGELTGYQGTTQDIDEQVRREEAVRESDDLQREALRIARASVWVWDRRTRLLSQSHDLYQWLGYDSAPGPFDDRVALRHPDDQASSRQLAEDAIRRREPYTIRYRLARAAGGWAWIEERGTPLFDASGTLTGYRGTTQDIDDQVKREEALRASDNRQREALHIARASLWAWDRMTRTLSESDDLYQMLGYATAPGSFDDRVALRHPDDQESSRQLSENAIRERVPYTIHYRLSRATGDWAWVEERGVPQFDEQGEFTGYRGTRQDVTEQREAESRIRRSEERLRAVLDSVGDGITLLSLDGRSNWANEAFHRMVGYTSAELDAMEPAVQANTLLDPDTVSDVTRWLNAAARGEGDAGIPRPYPMRLHHKDGGVLSAESTISILREEGTVAGLLSVIRDTTERDALRAQVEAATLEIRQILQTAAIPIIVIEEDGAISMANQRTFEVFGWTPEELVGQDASLLAAGPNPTSHREYIRHYHETGTASGPRGPMVGRTLEVLARHRDGHEFPVEVAVTEMVDPNGRRGYLGVVTDLTERIRAQEELLRMQKSEALGTLVAGVAHDFNNLLTAMVGGIELAKAQPGELRWLNLAQEAADRAIRLVQQLLQFSRRSHTELQNVIPAALVERTTGLMRETFDRRIQLQLELSQVWGVIPGDEGQLQQVVMNLLLNARDAVLERVDQGEADFTPAITVAMHEDRLPTGRAVRMEIRDNGTGMTAEVRARAFDPFFTTKPVDRGTGLGLATVAGIVEHHKGEVSVDSTVDVGTTFTIRLPLVDAPLVETASEEQSDDPPTPAIPTVMVIDDEEMVGAIMAGYLEAAGLRVIVMSDGDTAIDRLETTSDVDLVITDLNMPSPNGWEILARLHGRPGIPPIMMASGYADEETALERGAAAFLPKPFSQAELVQTVKRFLGRE